eukprot:755164-Hanusia_phi.AAC.6
MRRAISSLKPLKRREGPSHKFRRFFYDIVNHKLFEYAITFSICVNVVVMCLNTYNQDECVVAIIFWINFSFSCVFVTEAVFKLIGLGPKWYFTDKWNILDFLVVLISISTISIEFLRGDYSCAVSGARFFPWAEAAQGVTDREGNECLETAHVLVMLKCWSTGVPSYSEIERDSPDDCHAAGIHAVSVEHRSSSLPHPHHLCGESSQQRPNSFFAAHLWPLGDGGQPLLQCQCRPRRLWQDVGPCKLLYARQRDLPAVQTDDGGGVERHHVLLHGGETQQSQHSLLTETQSDQYKACNKCYGPYLGDGCGNSWEGIIFHVMWQILGAYVLVQLFTGIPHRLRMQRKLT